MSFILSQRLSLANLTSKLDVYYQPQISTKTKKVIGVEALFRWKNLSEQQFSELFNNDKDLQVLSFVTDRVIQDFLSFKGLLVSINITPFDLQNINFFPKVVNKILKNGIASSNIIFEIVETHSFKDSQRLKENLALLYALGFKISIDDFGSGHSCFAYLKHFPVHAIKIDKLFISEVLTCKFNQQLVQYIIGLCHNFGWIAVAEGVEDEATATLLTDWGIDEIQGYFYSKPKPITELQKYLKENT